MCAGVQRGCLRPRVFASLWSATCQIWIIYARRCADTMCRLSSAKKVLYLCQPFRVQVKRAYWSTLEQLWCVSCLPPYFTWCSRGRPNGGICALNGHCFADSESLAVGAAIASLLQDHRLCIICLSFHLHMRRANCQTRRMIPENEVTINDLSSVHDLRSRTTGRYV